MHVYEDQMCWDVNMFLLCFGHGCKFTKQYEWENYLL